MGVTGGPHIIEDGLVLSMDPGLLRSYVSGSSTVLNLADPSEIEVKLII